MEIGVTALRAELKRCLDAVRDGDDVVVTERGVPIARISAVDTAPLLRRLLDDGVVAMPRSTSRPRAADLDPVDATGSVSDLVSTLRD